MARPSTTKTLWLLFALTACRDHHPEGYEDPALHGVDLKLQAEDCRSCHGEDLAGDQARSCDGCHTDGWREDCTFCHGGDENDGGAPPRSAIPGSAFPEHGSHVSDEAHPAYECEQCHTTPEDVLSAGHILDGTAGVAEVVFTAGLSPEGQWSNGTCSNLYCHGNGQEPGEVEADEGPECGDCHAAPDGTTTELRTLSGAHWDHLREDLACDDCHGTVDGDEIAVPALHVDGEVSLDLPQAITRTNGDCTGRCHNENHNDEGWD